MKKKILIFNGAAVLVEEGSPLVFDVNGEKPIEEVEATVENVDKYLVKKGFPKKKDKS